MRAGIAFGSNLGDRLGHLWAARAEVGSLEKSEPPILASPIYETEPIDCDAAAGKFLNAVIEIGYTGDATELLQRLREIEKNLGRPSRHARNASRTLDLDLLYFGDTVLSTPELELPHPRMTTRRFVLDPLAEIRPELVLPSQKKTVAELLAALSDGSPLVRTSLQW
ncbi:MAG: 2-amino-4-hydroxy-6-hydroxymethyldihydropteridine diphosphokinase [Chthoniobacterales bacterium]